MPPLLMPTQTTPMMPSTGVTVGAGRRPNLHRIGGRKSRRALAPEIARRMVAVREVRRAYRRFYTSCFWSHRRDLEIGMEDVEWVARQLMKHGDREAWLIGKSLCP
jgi:hypothetical protein